MPSLLFDPGGMESALISQLNNLRGLENQLNNDIGELLLFIIRSIENAFNEGFQEKKIIKLYYTLYVI